MAVFDPTLIRYFKSLHDIQRQLESFENFKTSTEAVLKDLKKIKTGLKRKKKPQTSRKPIVLPTITECIIPDNQEPAGNSANESSLKHLASSVKCTVVLKQLSLVKTESQEEVAPKICDDSNESKVHSTPPAQHVKVEVSPIEQKSDEFQQKLPESNVKAQTPGNGDSSAQTLQKSGQTPRRSTRLSNGNIEVKCLEIIENSVRKEEMTLLKTEILENENSVNDKEQTPRKKSQSFSELNSETITKTEILGTTRILPANLTYQVDKPQPPDVLSSPVPIKAAEKRVTRSKMAKPKTEMKKNEAVEKSLESQSEKKVTQREISKHDDEEKESSDSPASKKANKTPEGEVASSKIPKFQFQSKRETSPETVPKPLPEKRITRSKKAKPKENMETEAAEETSPETVPKPLPEKRITRSKEKRITRSKMAKPKENMETEAAESLPPTSPPKPQIRMTRSKMAKPKQDPEPANKNDCDSSSSSDSEDQPAPPPSSKSKNQSLNNIINNFFSPAVRNFGKENQYLLMSASKSERKLIKITPLQNQNRPIAGTRTSGTKIPIIASTGKTKAIVEQVERKRREEELLRKRQEEAVRKKYELMKAKQEDIRRKNEEKKLRSAALREAVYKETTERLKVIEKEKEEKERAFKEQLQKKKGEEIVKKKLKEETKALEAEMRRLKEEEARLAKIKEMEEEKKKEEELKLKQQQEMEKNKKQRMEEMRMKESAFKGPEPPKKKVPSLLSRDKDNYDINDVQPDDDSDEDDERKPTKKEIPLWARKSEDKMRREKACALVSMEIVHKYFACPSKTPDLTEFFGKMTMKRVRTSSAVWLDTPPLKKKSK